MLPTVAAALGHIPPRPSMGSGAQLSAPDQMTHGDAVRAVGPLAAVAFAKANGRNPTPAEAARLVARLGKLPNLGSHAAALGRLGVQTRLGPPNWPNVAQDARAGHPVTLLTGTGPVVADNYSPSADLYHVGGRKPWMSAKEIVQTGGGIRAALHVQHPLVQQRAAAAP